MVKTRAAQRARLATVVGEDAARLQELKGQLVDRLMRSGVIVDLDIGRWRGLKRLYKIDLGLDDEAFKKVGHLIEYGHKRLLPRAYTNKLNSLETQARIHLEQSGFKTAFGVFVPDSSYAQWKARHHDLQQAYFAVGDEIAHRYRTIKRQVLAEYALAAHDAWRVAHPDGSKTGRLVFVRQYVERVEQAFPQPDVVRASFGFDFTLSFIPLTSVMRHEQMAQEKVDATSRKLEAERRMQDEVRAHYLTRKRELVDRYLQDVVGQLRTLVFDVCDDVLISIKRNGKLVSRSAVQLRNLMERIGALNFYGDQDIDRKLREVALTLEAPVRRGNEDMRTARLEALLIDLRDTCRAAKEGLENVDPLIERFMAIDVDPQA